MAKSPMVSVLTLTFFLIKSLNTTHLFFSTFSLQTNFSLSIRCSASSRGRSLVGDQNTNPSLRLAASSRSVSSSSGVVKQGNTFPSSHNFCKYSACVSLHSVWRYIFLLRKSMPSQASPSRISVSYSGLLRSMSVSSQRKMISPLFLAVYSQLNSAARAVPRWRCPVGLGGIRRTIGRSVVVSFIAESVPFSEKISIILSGMFFLFRTKRTKKTLSWYSARFSK